MEDRIDVDVAIVGAGVAGLWLANVFARRSLAVAVCEAGAIGGTQTAAAQGIVHSGVKYRLGGRGAAAARALESMPARWRAALAGRGDVDLRGVPILAEQLHLYCPAGWAMPRALLAGAFFGASGSCASGGRWTAAPSPYRRGLLLPLRDFVIDVPRLIGRLAAPVRLRLVRADVAPQDIVRAAGGVAGIETAAGVVRASAYVFAAGAGNGTLAVRAGFADVAMVRRSLRQVSVRLRQPPRLFAHCLTRPFGAMPDLTITSHGRTLYLGGRAATGGVGRSAAAQLAAVRRMLARAVPTLDLAGAEFHLHAVDRAEPAWGDHRFEDVFVAQRGNCLLCWPGKLSLAPRLGDAVAARLAHLQPRADPWPGGANGELQWATPPYDQPAVGKT